jgi:hypothetical protein
MQRIFKKNGLWYFTLDKDEIVIVAPSIPKLRERIVKYGFRRLLFKAVV